MFFINLFSWLTLLALLPLTVWVAWIKGRSAITCWIRLHSHPERWFLSARAPGESDPDALRKLLGSVVEQARTLDWDAAQTLKLRDPNSGDWIIGLVSPTRPLEEDPTDPFTFTQLTPSTVIRLSGQPQHDDVSVKDCLKIWSENRELPHKPTASSLSAQSFQCWEWDLEKESEVPRTSPPQRFSEWIFEMRIIVLVPLFMTLLSLAMLGTGNYWLLAIGMFALIFLSGACKFVFLHQREDATQESHLQNY
jgi:hypothetical protein